MPTDADRDLELRPYHESDRAELLDIAEAAWAPVFESFHSLLGPTIFDTAFPDWRMDKRGQIDSACSGDRGVHLVVADMGGRPVGFITYYLNESTRIAEIGNNAVHPDHQNAGIGARMYEHALAKMKEAGMKCARVTTGLDESHAPARRAYEKAGFDRSLPSVTYYKQL